MEPTRRLALPRGTNARQFTKLLLSLLSHAGRKWWVATVLPRALRFKRPLHRCNACNPDARPEGPRQSTNAFMDSNEAEDRGIRLILPKETHK